MSEEKPLEETVELEPQTEAEIEAQVQVEVPAAVDPSLLKQEQKATDKKEDLLGSLYDWETKNQEREWKEAGDTHNLRKTYTTKLFFVTCIWLLAVLGFVSGSAFQGAGFIGGFLNAAIGWNLTPPECGNCIARFHFRLSDKVLISFITSTTASVIGIFIIVVRWLFTPPAVTGAVVRAAVAARLAARESKNSTHSAR